MTCQDHKDLMMAYLDDELNGEQKRAFEAHLASCSDCAKDLEEFRKLKQMTDCVALAEPEDRVWDEYWNGLYNRMDAARGGSCSPSRRLPFSSTAASSSLETIIEDRTVGMLAKVGVLALVGGLAILFVSVLRERIYFWSRDRYKDVRR